VALHGAKYAEISPYLEEYLGLAHAAPQGGTLLPVTPVPWGVTRDGNLLSSRVQPFVNAAGYLTAENGNAVVLLDNYQAAKGHFPVRYRESLGTLAAGGPEAARPPLHDLLGHLRRSGVPVDAVLLWGPPEHFQRAPGGLRFLGELEEAFVPVAISRPTGLGRLYVASTLHPGSEQTAPPRAPEASDG
jgi:hypothetical protein